MQIYDIDTAPRAAAGTMSFTASSNPGLGNLLVCLLPEFRLRDVYPGHQHWGIGDGHYVSRRLEPHSGGLAGNFVYNIGSGINLGSHGEPCVRGRLLSGSTAVESGRLRDDRFVGTSSS